MKKSLEWIYLTTPLRPITAGETGKHTNQSCSEAPRTAYGAGSIYSAGSIKSLGHITKSHVVRRRTGCVQLLQMMKLWML